MSCDICARSSCAAWMHTAEEQKQFEKVIDAFNYARQLRDDAREYPAYNDETEETATSPVRASEQSNG